MTTTLSWLDRRLTQEGYKRLTDEDRELIRKKLHSRHPDDMLTAIEAAIHCNSSVRTIKRAIDAGKGPARMKNPDSQGTGAVNRHTRYRKGDLDTWMRGNTSFVTAYGRFTQFEHLVREDFWVMDGPRVAGHLFDVGDVDEALAILEADLVRAMRLDEALDGPWSDPGMRKEYWDLFRGILDAKQRAIQSAADRDALEAHLRDSGF